MTRALIVNKRHEERTGIDMLQLSGYYGWKLQINCQRCNKLEAFSRFWLPELGGIASFIPLQMHILTFWTAYPANGSSGPS